jgi:hypothetical protein
MDTVLKTAGEAMMLARTGEQQVAAALAAEMRHLARRIRARLSRSLLPVRVK